MEKDWDIDKGPLGRAHHRGAYTTADQAGVDNALAGSSVLTVMLASIEGMTPRPTHPNDYHLSHAADSTAVTTWDIAANDIVDWQ